MYGKLDLHYDMLAGIPGIRFSGLLSGDGSNNILLETNDENQWLWRIDNSYDWGIYWATNNNKKYDSGDYSTNPNEIVFVGGGVKRASIRLTTGDAHFNKVTASEIVVQSDYWADFVFEDSYDLWTLDKVENYISDNGHLPGVPSSVDIKENGVHVGENQAILLRKIEELTLYLLDQNSKIESLQKEVLSLKEIK